MTSAVFDAAAAASQVVTALLPQADNERAGQAKRYLKSDLDFLGVSVPAIRSAVRDVARTRRELDRDGGLAWARALWREPVHERRTAAIEVLRWYTGVNYLTDLAESADFKEVVALYRAAGLSLTKDLLTLNSASRVKARPNAEAYLVKNIVFNGRISVPVLTMHTTGDGLVVPENEQAYRSAVDQAGRASLLRQVFVHRAGHCTFTPAETVTAVQTLENRLATGQWHVPSPAAMNAQAAALGPLNVFTGGVATPPAFTRYSPAVYLRPFNLFPRFG